MDFRMKRRDFLKISALAGVAVIAAACQPTATPTAEPTVAAKATTAATTAATAAPTKAPTTAPTAAPTVVPTKVGFQGEIEFYAQAYTPTSVIASPDPKAPKHAAMAVLGKEWEALHPGVKLTFIPAPGGGDYDTWLSTQLIGGTGPDLFWYYSGSINDFADQGKVVPLNDYLELPNKYTPENKGAWKNSFQPPFLTDISLKGQYGFVPLDFVSTGVYCNVDMLKSVGIDLTKELVPELGSAKDWATLISWCKKIKDAGFNAFSMGGYITSWWLQGVLGDQLFWNLTPTFDKLNYHKVRSMASQEGLISQEEIFMQYLCNNWKAFAEPATQTMFEIIKDLTQYMPVGFLDTATMWSAGYDLYVKGQLAMYWDGSWQVGAIMQDPSRKFEFSSFWLPPVTKETTPLANETPILPLGVGAWGAGNYGINRKCIAKGDVDDIVDWEMYMTTPQHDEMIVNEVPSFITAVKGARSLPEVENMWVGESRMRAGFGRPWLACTYWFSGEQSKYQDTFGRELQLYLLSDQDLDTFMAHVDAAAKEAAPAVVRATAIQYSAAGDWDLTQWTCQPTI